MISETISNLEKYIHNKLMLLFFFAGRFEKIIDNDLNHQKRMLQKASKEYDSVKDLKLNYLTFGRLAEIEKEDPNLYGNILKNFGSSIQKSIIELNINVAENNFKELGLNSIFLMSFAFFENAIVKVCTEIGNEKNIKIGLSDIKGSTLDAVKIYLTKVLLIDYNFSKNINWNLIIKYQKIRNYITHYGNSIFNDDKLLQISNVIKDLDNIIISKNEIIIEKEFITNSLKVYEKLFKSLFKQINKTT